METARLRIVDWLRERARTHVVVAWVLLVPAILAAFLAVASVAISLTYFDMDEWIGYDWATRRLAFILVGGAFFAATISSIALAVRQRELASIIVLGSWSLMLIVGIGQYLFVKRGPQHYERYVGQQRFNVPWQYEPRGSEAPVSQAGFSSRFCFPSLEGRYGQACEGERRIGLSIYPSSENSNFNEDDIWRRPKNESKSLRGEYEAYTNGKMTYYRHVDPNGKLLALVTCYGPNQCQRRVRTGNYILSYETLESAFSE